MQTHMWWIFQIEDTLVQPQSFVRRLSSGGDSSFSENEGRNTISPYIYTVKLA
jgi:hypothetical protein